MIDTSIQTLAHEHASQLAAKGVFVAPRPGTPLAELVGYCREGVDPTAIAFAEDLTHTKEGLADFLADNARRYNDFARNIAKPALEALQEVVQNGIQQIQLDPFMGMNIEEIGAPAILEDAEFLRSVSHYNSGMNQLPAINPRFGSRTEQQIIEMCATGSSVWDESVKQWLVKLPEGQLQSIWQSVFMDKVNNDVTAPIQSIENLMKDYSKGHFSALVIFLLAQRMHQDVDDEIGLDLSTARQFLYALLQAAAYDIGNGINWFNSFVSTSSLVSVVDRTNRTIRVNAAVYKQYLADGGKADVLMGMIVTGKQYHTVAEINAHAEELMADWSRYAIAQQSSSEAAYEVQVRELMTKAFATGLDTTYGDAEAEKLAEPGVKDTAINIFAQELGSCTRGQLHANWLDVLWRSACKARFHYHSAIYPLLDTMDYQVRERGADPESANTIAMQQLVATFIAEMTQKV